MTTSNFEFKSRDELTLMGNKIIPSGTPKAILCLVHGFGEHQDRYLHVGEALAKVNIAFFSFDLRGHGKSEGKRGHSPRHEYFIDDIEELLIEARKVYNDTPIFLMGHSFGGHLVANFLMKKMTNEVTAAILSSPWFQLAFEPSPFKLKLANIMAKIYPGYSDKSEMDTSRLTRDSSLVKAYEDDPLVLSTITAGLFTSIVKANNWLLEQKKSLKIPILLYHGTADEIISIKGSERFVENIQSEIVFEKLDGVYHEPHNDIGKEKIIGRVIRWIEQHIA